MSWFFEQFFHGTKLLDYSVGEVTVRKRLTDAGQFDRGTGKELVTRKQAEDLDRKLERDRKLVQWEGIVKIRRLQDAVAPVDIEIRFEDGHLERKYWDGSYRWVRYNFLRPSKIASVEVDPKQKLQLDLSYSNNSWQGKYNVALSTRWTGQLLFWVQNIMLWMSAIA
jgi:hypothetical protein